MGFWLLVPGLLMGGGGQSEPEAEFLAPFTMEASRVHIPGAVAAEVYKPGVQQKTVFIPGQMNE